MKIILLAVVVVAAAGTGAYFLMQTPSLSVQTTQSSGNCKEIGAVQIESMVRGYMKSHSYDNYETVAVSPEYCNQGIGTYNLHAEAVIDEGLPTQHNKTVRMQVRSDSMGVKIYEVVLDNPG